jgi:murein DD-endopeptidase MepM/ murein hydrolase activator NlpD
MESENAELIQQLNQVIDLIVAQKKEDSLTKKDWETFSIADAYFGKKYFFSKSYSLFLKKLPVSAVEDQINNLQQKSSEQVKEGSSIPPELESMVEEYRQNQATLAEKEIKSNSQRSVAEQVKIAIAHSKIKEQALQNKEKRRSNRERFKNTDDVFVSLGSPKSSSKTQALSKSYSAVKEVAFTYKGFTKLSPQVQNQIITSAVELNTIGIIDIDTAIQSSTLLIDFSTLSDSDKNNLATIPGGFVSSVFHEIQSSEKITQENNEKIFDNEEQIQELRRQQKTEQIQELIEENQHLAAFNENQANRLINQVAKQTESFKDFEKSRETRLSMDPDLKDLIDDANKEVSRIHNNLQSNGIQPRVFSPMDDAKLLEDAIRNDMPGALRAYSGYEAEQAAAIIGKSQIQDPSFSPQAILLYGRDLTPKLLADVRSFAKKNPESSLGILYNKRKDLFTSAGVQIRKISESKLGKDISKGLSGAKGGFNSVSRFFNGISDKLPGGFKGTFRAISNPWGTFKSWVGKKAGEQIATRLVEKIGNEVIKNAANTLLSEGLKGGIATLSKEALSKMAVKAATWASTKLGISIALESVNGLAPGVGLLLDVVVQTVLFVAEKTIGAAYKAVQETATSVYGEKIKFRDLLAVPVAGATTAIGGTIAWFGILISATYVAAKSATVTILLGTLIGFFFYITSIVVAPLISTLVQLQSQTVTSMPINCANMPWPFDGIHTVTQGPNVAICTHHGGISESADFSMVTGTPIKSMTDGTVILAINSDSGYGNHVIIEAQTDSGETFKIIYGHFVSLSVGTGESVTAGQVIGLSGNTGNSTGPHLHLGYIGNVPYNSCPAGGFQIDEGCCNGETFNCNQP